MERPLDVTRSLLQYVETPDWLQVAATTTHRTGAGGETAETPASGDLSTRVRYRALEQPNDAPGGAGLIAAAYAGRDRRESRRLRRSPAINRPRPSPHNRR